MLHSDALINHDLPSLIQLQPISATLGQEFALSNGDSGVCVSAKRSGEYENRGNDRETLSANIYRKRATGIRELINDQLIRLI
jgi:hypothetical protein